MQYSLAQHVAAKIRGELAERSMTWSQLAAKLGKSEMWVSRRLRSDAKTEISFGDLEQIAWALGQPATRYLPAAGERAGTAVQA